MALWVGAEAPPNSSESYQDAFIRVDDELGPLRVYRVYLQQSPWTPYSSNSKLLWTKDAGVHPFVSITTPPDQIAAGTWDSELTTFIQSFPVGWQWWLTCNHEPEAPDKGIDPADWVAAISHLHTLAHSVSSDVDVIPINMTFQWRTGGQVDATGGPSAWTVPAANCDGYGTDTYGGSGNTFTTLQSDTRHMRWHNNFSGLGKPLWVAERGIAASYGETAVAGYLSDDETWMLANGYEGLLYWQVTNGDFELTGDSALEYQAIASGSETGSEPMLGTAALYADTGSSSTSTVTGTLVAWSPGDTVLVPIWLSASASITVTPPSGWTQVDSPQVASSNNWTRWLFSRKMQSGDTNPIFTLSAGRINRAISINAGPNWDEIISPGSNSGINVNALTTGFTTPDAEGQTSLVIVGFRDTSATSPTWTNDANLTQDAAFDGTGASPNTHYWVGHGFPPASATQYTETTSQQAGAYTATALTLVPSPINVVGVNLTLTWDVESNTGGGGPNIITVPTQNVPPVPQEGNSSRYTYVAADLLSNKIYGDLPLVSVSMDRAISGVGNLSASLHLDDENYSNSDLLAWTTTGKTSLYVYRDDTIVWGGIIWTRTYQSQGKSLQITAQTFESYAYKRIFRPPITTEWIDDQCNLVVRLWTELQKYSNSYIGVQSPTNVPLSGITRDYVFNPWDFRTFGDIIEDITTNFDDSCQYYINVFEDPNSGKPVKQLVVGYPVASQATGLVCDYPGNVTNYYYTENANEGADKWWATGDGSEADLVIGVAEDYAVTGGSIANLVSNPDFEGSTAGWNTYNFNNVGTTTLTRNTTTPLSGSASANIAWTAASISAGVYWNLDNPIQENTAITVRFTAQYPNTVPNKMRVLYQTSATSEVVFIDDIVDVPTDAPRTIVSKLIVPVDKIVDRIFIYGNSGSGSGIGAGSFLLDDVNISTGEYAGPLTPTNPLIENVNSYTGVTQQDTIDGHAASDLKNNPVPVGKWQISIKPEDIETFFFTAVGYTIQLRINKEEDPRFADDVDIPVQTYGWSLQPSGSDVEQLDLTLDNTTSGGGGAI